MPTTTNRAPLITLPNAVSASRLLFAAGFLAARDNGMRLGLIGVASASDFLDGWLARRQGTTTRLGALIDPIADRAFAVAAVSGFLLHGDLTPMQCLVFLSRDIATALGFLVAQAVPSLRHAVFKARWSGKVVTVLQLATLAAVILAPRSVPALVAVVGAASALSIVDYTRSLWLARARP
jgi:cardiolipin synthase (CMP-forming)